MHCAVFIVMSDEHCAFFFTETHLIFFYLHPMKKDPSIFNEQAIALERRRRRRRFIL